MLSHSEGISKTYMYSLLLAIIYIAFISLGLPDSLLGSAWPVMQQELQVPLSYAGIISMTIAGGTIISSLLSDRLTKRLGTGLVTAISVMMTAIALFGFSISGSMLALIAWAIPYGLGAGAVDAALNNYVSLHYSSRHMSWLHCFWGVGATISPYIMSFALIRDMGWHSGYRIVGIIQLVLAVFLIFTLPLWVKNNGTTANGEPSNDLGIIQALKIPGVPYILLTFLAYCALESTTGLWASSYLVRQRGVAPETAASFASFFYLGITIGRFISGFVADHFGNRTMIRLGSATATLGVLMVLIPTSGTNLALIGLIVVGLGGAPIYPSIIHSTPANFGRQNSQAIIGIQMASAYVGSTFAPPLFGFIAGLTGIVIYPFYLLLFAVLMIFTHERMTKRLAA